MREHAQDRVFGNVGALKNIKRRHPATIIAVCGCMTEQEHVAERFKKSYPFVNIVFGTHVIHRLPEMLYTTLTDSKRVFLRGHEGEEVLEGIPTRRDGTSRAWVTVMLRLRQLLLLLYRALCAGPGEEPPPRGDRRGVPGAGRRPATRRSPCWARTSTPTARAWRSR